MPAPDPQLLFPFASLDFPGRSMLYPHEVAEKLGMSADHLHDLMDDGSLVGMDIASPGASRREMRIPIESYRNFIVARMTGPLRIAFLTTLPEATRRELVTSLLHTLSAAVRQSLLKAS